MERSVLNKERKREGLARKTETDARTQLSLPQVGSWIWSLALPASEDCYIHVSVTARVKEPGNSPILARAWVSKRLKKKKNHNEKNWKLVWVQMKNYLG